MMLNKGIFVILVIVFLLTGYIAWPYIRNNLYLEPAGSEKTVTSDGVTVRTSLEPALTKEAISFIRVATKRDLLPADIVLRRTQKGNEKLGDVYMASWNKDGKYLTLLVGLTLNNEAINYERIWHAPIADNDDNAQRAQKLLLEVFDEGFVQEKPFSSCEKTNPSSEKPLTECGAMKTDANGNLFGVTVRTPVTLMPTTEISQTPDPGQPDVTVVEACFVPKAGTSAYTASLCI